MKLIRHRCCVWHGIMMAVCIATLARVSAAQESKQDKPNELRVLGEEFQHINGGRYDMGYSDPDVAAPDNIPVHTVEISDSFYVCRYEVTVGEILKWLNSPDVTVSEDWIRLDVAECPVVKSGSEFVLNDNSRFGKSGEQPMICISWFGAKEYCKWCTDKDMDYTYRLPTEAEWEYFARAGTATRFYWGRRFDAHKANLLSDDGSASRNVPVRGCTKDVGSYNPNPWGLYDVSGNVCEWCSDWYQEDYYKQSPLKNPQGPLQGIGKVRRGGAWASHYSNGRSGARSFGSPHEGSLLTGFRVVAERRRPVQK